MRSEILVILMCVLLLATSSCRRRPPPVGRHRPHRRRQGDRLRPRAPFCPSLGLRLDPDSDRAGRRIDARERAIPERGRRRLGLGA
jgi:hypothetical protein